MTGHWPRQSLRHKTDEVTCLKSHRKMMTEPRTDPRFLSPRALLPLLTPRCDPAVLELQRGGLFFSLRCFPHPSQPVSRQVLRYSPRGLRSVSQRHFRVPCLLFSRFPPSLPLLFAFASAMVKQTEEISKRHANHGSLATPHYC